MKIRVKTSTWYEANVKYERTNDKEISEKVSENYVIEASSCTEAEKRIIEELYSYSDIKVKKTNEASYQEILFNSEAEKYWKVKIQMALLDESNRKEKRTNLLYLVQANNIEETIRNIRELFKDSVSDYDIVGINEAKVVNVIEE